MSAPTVPVAAVMPGLFRELVHAVMPDARTMQLTTNDLVVFFAVCGCPCQRVTPEHPWMQWSRCGDCEAIWDRIAATSALTLASGGNDDR